MKKLLFAFILVVLGDVKCCCDFTQEEQSILLRYFEKSPRLEGIEWGAESKDLSARMNQLALTHVKLAFGDLVSVSQPSRFIYVNVLEQHNTLGIHFGVYFCSQYLSIATEYALVSYYLLDKDIQGVYTFIEKIKKPQDPKTAAFLIAVYACSLWFRPKLFTLQESDDVKSLFLEQHRYEYDSLLESLGAG